MLQLPHILFVFTSLYGNAVLREFYKTIPAENIGVALNVQDGCEILSRQWAAAVIVIPTNVRDIQPVLELANAGAGYRSLFIGVVVSYGRKDLEQTLRSFPRPPRQVLRTPVVNFSSVGWLPHLDYWWREWRKHRSSSDYPLPPSLFIAS